MEFFVDINGEFQMQKSEAWQSGSRAYLYGDGLFETILVNNGKILSLDAHIDRMIAGAKVLKMRIPSFFSSDFFEKRISNLMLKSAVQGSARVRISIDRIAGGTYAPVSNEVTYMIEVFPIVFNGFELNNKGFEVDLFNDVKKQLTPWANFKTKNGLLYVMAAIKAQEEKLDDMLLVNSNLSVIESSNSNIFLVSNGMLYTPSLDSGCLAGVMRMKIINLALQNGIKVYECNITPQNLLVADELLLTNAIKGVQWAGGYRTKRYSNQMANRLINLLNEQYGA